MRYFQPAYQLGMTATPLRQDNRDTYRYFGNPIYTYNLRQGIEDGFLALYRVHRIITEWDAAGWRPSKGDLDRYGRDIPDAEYQTVDFERAVALKARTEAIARNLTDFLKKTDRFAKTIVFCVADPDFDGEPAYITEQEMNETGETTKEIATEETNVAEQEGESGSVISDDLEGVRRKYYFDGGRVEIAAHLVYELDPDGKQLRVVKFSEYAAEKVRTLYPSAAELRKQWADPTMRAEIISKLEERGIDFDQLRSASNQPDADPFDLLCHLAFNGPLRTRRERADRVKKEEKRFFEKHGPEAKAILSDLLEKYAEHGTAQFVIPDVLKVPPISVRGNVIEIAALFGRPEKLREAVNELQALLYAA